MTEPEFTPEPLPVDVAEAEADLTDEFERPAPSEAAEADVIDQKRSVEGDEDDYRDR